MKQRRQIMNAGFTLIEMMVVLTLIGILVVVAATNYFTSLARARDARRKSDIRLIQSALEQYNTLCGGVYPTPQGSFYTSVSCANVGTILGTVPTDPGTTPYACPTPLASNCTGTKYTICATLEKETPSGFCLGNSQ